MVERCGWAGTEPIYVDYHDTEWGVPEYDSRALWEKLILDGFQAGLSWITILKKRENFRAAFAGFDPHVIATWGEDDVRRLLADPGIIRHRGKIKSTINNANRALELIEEKGSLAAYFWAYEPKEEDRPKVITKESIPGFTDVSTAISKDLKKRGWSFVGPTTVYAFMQAMGMVNDHIHGCQFRERIERLRAEFVRPT